MKSKKGFTMTELVISMAVSTILMAIVIGVLVISKQNMDNSTKAANRLNEFYKIEKIINNWFSTFSTPDYELLACEQLKVYSEGEEYFGRQIVSSGLTPMVNSGNNLDYNHTNIYSRIAFRPKTTSGDKSPFLYSIYYERMGTKNSLIVEMPTGKEILDLSMVDDVVFTKMDNLIKVTLTYNESMFYTLLFNYDFDMFG